MQTLRCRETLRSWQSLNVIRRFDSAFNARSTASTPLRTLSLARSLSRTHARTHHVRTYARTYVRSRTHWRDHRPRLEMEKRRWRRARFSRYERTLCVCARATRTDGYSSKSPPSSWYRRIDNIRACRHVFFILTAQSSAAATCCGTLRIPLHNSTSCARSIRYVL